MLLIPYFLIPILVSLHVRKRYSKGSTYILTAVIIFLYPFTVLWLVDLLNPPEEGPRCLTPQTMWIVGNLFFFLPLSLGLQWLAT